MHKIMTLQIAKFKLGHTNLILCFSDSAGLFLADLKKKKKKFLISISDIMIVTGQEYSSETALLACYW